MQIEVSKMTTISIDPGKSGGLAYRHDDQPVNAIHMPETEGDIVDFLRGLVTDPAQTLAVIEQVGGYVPGRPQPGSAMFRFGRNFGFILGVLQTLGVRVELVRPQAWQKALSLGNSKDCPDKAAWKAKLKAEAQRRYPLLKPTLATADALLILDYALRASTNLPADAAVQAERQP